VDAWFWMTMDTERMLIGAMARDLDGSFEALVLAHQDRLYSIALRLLGDPRDAEEAAQDAFVRAHRALATYEPERILELRLRPWLATIVLNLCRSRLGRRAARAAIARPALSLDATELGTLEPRADAAAEPSTAAVRRDTRQAWAALLMTLPPAYRSAVVLRHVDGLSYPEVATALDRPEGTVKAQVHRGLALLRTAFEAAQQREREEMTA
jgi:RNA polymerase sigma-70 factor (ECF subfamily)